MTKRSKLLRGALNAFGCVSCAGLVPGCSWLFVEAPPAEVSPSQPVTCTRGKAAPIIDSVVTGLQTVRVVYAITQDESDYKDFPISRGADIGIGLGMTVLFAASAAYGFTATEHCAAAEQAASAAAAPPTHTGSGTAATAPSPSTGDDAPAVACSFDAQCVGEDRCLEGRCEPPVQD